jgi:hypothetical protein
MTPTDGPRYVPGVPEIIVPLDLERMPITPARFAVNDLIADRAQITFEVIDGAPVFLRIELYGRIPLKTGGPSKRPQSDGYWSFDRDMPEAIQSVVAFATDHVREMLK